MRRRGDCVGARDDGPRDLRLATVARSFCVSSSVLAHRHKSLHESTNQQEYIPYKKRISWLLRRLALDFRTLTSQQSRVPLSICAKSPLQTLLIAKPHARTRARARAHLAQRVIQTITGTIGGTLGGRVFSATLVTLWKSFPRALLGFCSR